MYINYNSQTESIQVWIWQQLSQHMSFISFDRPSSVGERFVEILLYWCYFQLMWQRKWIFSHVFLMYFTFKRGKLDINQEDCELASSGCSQPFRISQRGGRTTPHTFGDTWHRMNSERQPLFVHEKHRADKTRLSNCTSIGTKNIFTHLE